MFRTKGMHGFRLYPDRAYLEIHVQLYNRTSEPQTFLWWANPAVHVQRRLPIRFPARCARGHGPRQARCIRLPDRHRHLLQGQLCAGHRHLAATRTFPCRPRTWRITPISTFMGCYDHGAQAGMMHVANHHVVPGKKQWTWGNGDFGQAWDRQLTDEDGPYIELMCGAYTDNQPDFSWIMPGEEKRFTQIFMPYKKIGPPCNANEHVALSLEFKNDEVQLGVYTSAERTVNVRLALRGVILYEKQVTLDPENVLIDRVKLPTGTLPQDVQVDILEGSLTLLTYIPLPEKKPEIPAPATPARPPAEIETIEELFLNGLHLEQYRHATYAPEPYYLEALRRDPGDSRCNNALGLLLYRRGKFSQAEAYFRAAIQRLTLRNPNPYDGEPYYNLGLALKMQGRYPEAFDAFHKAVWNAAWQDAAYFELARLTSREGKIDLALEYTERCLRRNGRHAQARQLKIALLRHTGQVEAARTEAAFAIEQDYLEYGALYERFLLDGDPTFEQVVHPSSGTLQELALDYAHAGLFEDAITLLSRQAQDDPMAAYTLGWILEQANQAQKALERYRQAAALPCDYCFPNRLEDVLILEAAQGANPADGRAPYYLGNFWYAHQQYEDAIACWERAAGLDDAFATVHRNLGLAYFNKRKDPQKALAQFEKAFTLDPTDGRVFFELDQLYKRLNYTPEQRLENLARHPGLVRQRDDLTIEYITLLNLLGRPVEAYQALMGRNFHPWEGGEGKVTGQYVASLVEMAKTHITAGEGALAVALLERAQIYPPNLGEGKLYGAQENNIYYYSGCAYEVLGEQELAKSAFRRASMGVNDPASPRYYNDQPPDMIFYQGLALSKLGQEHEAQALFNKLVDYGNTHIDDEVTIDYFAVSLPDFLVFEADLNEINRLHCRYLLGLGTLGLGDSAAARAHFEAVLALDASHLGANLHLGMI